MSNQELGILPEVVPADSDFHYDPNEPPPRLYAHRVSAWIAIIFVIYVVAVVAYKVIK